MSYIGEEEEEEDPISGHLLQVEDDPIAGHLLEVENDPLGFSLDDEDLERMLEDDASMIDSRNEAIESFDEIQPAQSSSQSRSEPIPQCSNPVEEEPSQASIESSLDNESKDNKLIDPVFEIQWSRPTTPQTVPSGVSRCFKVPAKRSRRLPRTITKLAKGTDPEKMPLCERLFYNPPETIYQKENKVNFISERRGSSASLKSETKSNASSQEGRSRSSSRASSIDSHASSKSSGTKRGRMIIESDEDDDETNLDVANNNKRANSRAGSVKDEDSNSHITMRDDDASNKSHIELIIDEVTGQVVINNPEALAEQERTEASNRQRRVVSEQSRTTYSSFRRRRERSKSMWNAEETATFYAALERIGTDFSLMEAIFFKDSPRDRRQLKQKFKREEKTNRDLIDAILYKSLHAKN